jgi:hypothetical protein
MESSVEILQIATRIINLKDKKTILIDMKNRIKSKRYKYNTKHQINKTLKINNINQEIRKVELEIIELEISLL